MQKYLITIGARHAPRLSFEALAPNSSTALVQHADLAQPGEAVRVTAAVVRAQDVAFLVEGSPYGREDMLSANQDDAELCEWVRTARPGDVFPALADCRAVSADDQVAQFRRAGAI